MGLVGLTLCGSLKWPSPVVLVAIYPRAKAAKITGPEIKKFTIQCANHHLEEVYELIGSEKMEGGRDLLGRKSPGISCCQTSNGDKNEESDRSKESVVL